MNTNMRAMLSAGANLTDPAEIEANRRGQVTEAQRKRLNPLLREGLGALLGVGRLVRIGVIAIIPSYVAIRFGAPAWAVGAAVGVVALIVVVALGVQAAGFLRRAALVKQDLDNKEIAQGPGHLVFGGDRYEAEVQGRRLQVAGGGAGLATGTHYNFFYLPASGVVLSAEARGPMTAAQGLANLKSGLARANGFKTEALENNRAGRLGPGQAANLLPRLGLALALFAIAGVVAVLSQLPRLLTSGAGLEAAGPMLRSSGFLIVGAGLPTVIGLFYGLTALADLLLGKVAMVEGDGQRIQTVSSRRSSSGSMQTSYTHYYQIGSRRFKVKREAYGALVEGVPYRAYYTTISGTLVNLEPLAAPTIV